MWAVPNYEDATRDLLPVVHVHLMVVVPAGQVDDLRALLDPAAADALAAIRRPQERIVDSQTYRRILLAVAGEAVVQRHHGPTTEVDVDVPVIGEPAVGEVIEMAVRVGRSNGLSGEVLVRGVECGVRQYRRAAALAGLVAVGEDAPDHLARPPMHVTEQAARLDAIHWGLVSGTHAVAEHDDAILYHRADTLGECHDVRGHGDARYAAGDAPESVWVAWDGSPRAWLRYVMRARQGDREMTDGHPGAGGRYRPVYGPYDLTPAQTQPLPRRRRRKSADLAPDQAAPAPLLPTPTTGPCLTTSTTHETTTPTPSTAAAGQGTEVGTGVDVVAGQRADYRTRGGGGGSAYYRPSPASSRAPGRPRWPPWGARTDPQAHH
jgi:hypothetical protein